MLRWTEMTGHERDTLMADKVMNGLISHHGSRNGRIIERLTISINGRGRKWSPSTDIFDAFQVSEQMRTMGWQYSMSKYRKMTEFVYNASFVGDEPKRGGDAHAVSAPEAICLAALEALGVEMHSGAEVL